MTARTIDPTQFLGIPSHGKDGAEALLLPVPFEKTVSYGTGTHGGPHAIFDASLQIELFDDETLLDFERDIKLHALPPVVQNPDFSAEEYLAYLQEEVKRLRGNFILGLGGEHLMTYGMVMGITENPDELTLVHIDAHADCADRLNGVYWSHGTVMRRLWEKGCRFVQVGIRSLCRSEYELVSSDSRFSTYFAHQLPDRWNEAIEEIRNLKGKVFLTFDVDGLDPGIIPSTGTPQPEGLNWRQAMELIKAVAFNKQIDWIGGDVVEFVPSPNPPGCDIIAAKLVYKILAWRHRGLEQRGETILA